MTKIPLLENYNVKILVNLGNNTDDVFTRNKIKVLIVEKLMATENCSMFFLINKFRNSTKILKEAYAEIITMSMKDNFYNLGDNIINEVVSLVSLDTLIYYGAESRMIQFSKKCKEEFWNRAILIEDKNELRRKNSKKRIRKKLMIWKGDKND